MRPWTPRWSAMLRAGVVPVILLAALGVADARILATSATVAVSSDQASAMTEPDQGGSSLGPLLAGLVIVAIVGLCLWLLFRRGSIGDRARVDVPDPDGRPPEDDDPGR